MLPNNEFCRVCDAHLTPEESGLCGFCKVAKQALKEQWSTAPREEEKASEVHSAQGISDRLATEGHAAESRSRGGG